LTRERGAFRGRARGRDGFTLIEVMVAAFLLLIVLLGVTQLYVRSRTHLDYEEDRRKATAVAELRLDALRRDFRYDDLAGLDGSDTTYVSDGRNYTISHAIRPYEGALDDSIQATLVKLTVSWNAMVQGTAVPESLVCTTTLGRGMP
jgi:prepilin-type N-terminal cleavage/methylation domain-containing protein